MLNLSESLVQSPPVFGYMMHLMILICTLEARMLIHRMVVRYIVEANSLTIVVVFFYSFHGKICKFLLMFEE